MIKKISFEVIYILYFITLKLVEHGTRQYVKLDPSGLCIMVIHVRVGGV